MLKLTAILIALVLALNLELAVGQSPVADTSKTENTADTSLVKPPNVAFVDTARAVIRARFSSVSDSLLSLIYRDHSSSRESFPDRPQANSNWQLDPALYRSSITPWGDFESFYTYGLAPSQLSRSDNFVGEQSYANPIPLAYSEEFIRSEPSDRSYILTPALSGLFAPFGRVTDIHQQSDLADFDTATSTIYVNRARGGFANTTFEFKSNFGRLGSLRTDGTFQKTDGLIIGANTNMRRMRILLEPRLTGKWRSNVLYSFNRLEGSKLFFPDNYDYEAHVSDYYANLSTSICYLRSDNTQLDLRLSYRNDDQYVDQIDLVTSQGIRIVESAAEYQVRSERHTIGIDANIRHLHFASQSVAANSVYFDVGARELYTMSPRSRFFGSATIVGSSDLSLRPSFIGSILYDLNNESSVSLTAAHRTILPQPEMLYLQPVSASLFDSTIDYSISGDPELGSGTARIAEIAYDYGRQSTQLRLAAGLSRLVDVADWQINDDSMLYGAARPVEVDKNVYFASIVGRVQPFNRISTMFAYGIRKVQSDGNNLTFGPMHTASGSAWYGFPIKRFKLWINMGVGATFRSAINKHVYRGVDDGVVIAESYFSFDLKRFHFYFNYHNLLNVDYTLNGIAQPGRSIWWGFRWKFID